jgi:hypothetical protein
MMNRTIATFLLVTLLTGLLTAASIALEIKGYGFGALGTARLDGIANAASFVPLAALYAFSAALMMILPLRAAGLVYANAAAPLNAAVLVLMATILGVQIARFAFGNTGSLQILLDWQFVFAIGIVGSHMVMNTLRRDVLMRTLSFVAFLAATLACLYWTFRL